MIIVFFIAMFSAWVMARAITRRRVRRAEKKWIAQQRRYERGFNQYINEVETSYGPDGASAHSGTTSGKTRDREFSDGYADAAAQYSRDFDLGFMEELKIDVQSMYPDERPHRRDRDR